MYDSDEDCFCTDPVIEKPAVKDTPAAKPAAKAVEVVELLDSDDETNVQQAKVCVASAPPEVDAVPAADAEVAEGVVDAPPTEAAVQADAVPDGKEARKVRKRIYREESSSDSEADPWAEEPEEDMDCDAEAEEPEAEEPEEALACNEPPEDKAAEPPEDKAARKARKLALNAKNKEARKVAAALHAANYEKEQALFQSRKRERDEAVKDYHVQREKVNKINLLKLQRAQKEHEIAKEEAAELEKEEREEADADDEEEQARQDVRIEQIVQEQAAAKALEKQKRAEKANGQ